MDDIFEFTLNITVYGQKTSLKYKVGEGYSNSTSISIEDNHIYVDGIIQDFFKTDNDAPLISVDVSDETLEVTESNRKISLEEVFKIKYPEKFHLYKHICNAIGHHVEFSDLTKINLMKIKDYLIERVSANTVILYLGTIKAIMNMFAEDNLFECKGYGKILKHKRCPSMNVYLTEEEISRIERYVPMTPTECDIKVMFLIEYYTGARISDVEKFDISNIVDGKIVYISKKTHVLSKVPIHKNLLQLLQYRRSSEHSRTVYNRTIKNICKKVGINTETNIFYHGKQRKCPKYMFVGSHTARRSFATNLALRGVPINVISKLINHNGNIDMTERYILASVDEIDDTVLAFFR